MAHQEARGRGAGRWGGERRTRALTAHGDLDRLLAQDPSPIEARARALRQSLEDGLPLVLYGAGRTGRAVLAGLRHCGIEPAAFADDTPEKQGTGVEGVAVVAPSEAIQRAGADCAVAVTMVNPALPFAEACRRLAGVTRGPVVSVYELARALPDPLLPFGFVEEPRRLLARAAEIHATARLFDRDPESSRQLAAHLRFRLELDPAVLPAPTEPAYFPPELLEALPDGFRLVDGGAYDGDTIRELLALRPRGVEQIIAFEPDHANHARLVDYVASLSADVATSVEVRAQALGDRVGRESFVDTGDPSARIAAEGPREVDVVTLDTARDIEGAQLYIKLDVEGAEAKVLRGAEALLRRDRPALAVSVYHRPEDLWEIPRRLDAFDLGYRFLLRTHGRDGADLVLYAIPADCLGEGSG